MLFGKRKDLDLTSGPLFKTIIFFALPIMLANVVTTLFSAADMMVLSWFAEGNEIASVGATSSVISLFTQFAIGLCTGVNIVLARLIGQGDESQQDDFQISGTLPRKRNDRDSFVRGIECVHVKHNSQQTDEES